MNNNRKFAFIDSCPQRIDPSKTTLPISEGPSFESPQAWIEMWNAEQYGCKPGVHSCEACGVDPSQPMHTCPYKEEIGGDGESLCNCCSNCHSQCCGDI